MIVIIVIIIKITVIVIIVIIIKIVTMMRGWGDVCGGGAHGQQMSDNGTTDNGRL